MQPELSVTMMPTSELVPYAGNAKEHPDWQIGQIAASIEQFGFNDPVGIWHNPDGDPVIVEGHGRVLAAKMLGIENLPTVTLDHLDDEGRRAYTLAHNKLTTNTGYDEGVLASELDAIEGIDMSEFGFDAPIILEELDGVREDSLPEAVDVASRASLGDVWMLGDHVLLCGDATKAEDVAKVMQGGEADLLLTDPPYNVAYHQNDSSSWDPKLAKQRTDRKVIMNDKFTDELSFQHFIEDATAAALSVMRPGAAYYVWMASMHAPAVFAALEECGVSPKQELVWVKNHFALGRNDYQWMHEAAYYGWKGGGPHYFAPTRCETTVFDDMASLNKMSKPELRKMLEEILSPDAATTVLRFDKPLSSAEHPTMKPVLLFARLIRNSTQRDEIILDPFGGSGTTIIACEQLGRKARCIELDPQYCDVIITRWEQFTGEKAVLLEEQG